MFPLLTLYICIIFILTGRRAYSQFNDTFGEMETRLQFIERELSRIRNEFEAKLESERQARTVLEISISNLTSELEKERNIRIDLEKTLSELKSQNESSCTIQCGESDQSYLLILLGDLQQQLQLLQNSIESTKKKDSQKYIFFQKQLHQLSVSLFDLSYVVSSLKNTSATKSDLINATNRTFNSVQKKIDDIHIRMNITSEEVELLNVFQQQQQVTIVEHAGKIKSLNNRSKQLEIYVNLNSQDLRDLENNCTISKEELELQLKSFDKTLLAKENLFEVYAGKLIAMNETIGDTENMLQLLNATVHDRIQGLSHPIPIEAMNDKIMFSAVFHDDGPFSDYDVRKLKFNSMRTNHGLGYDLSTGVFTSHSNGYFVFFWDIHVPPGKVCDTVIKKNGGLVLDANANARGSSGSDMASAMIILALNKGDEVWIETGACESFYGNIHSSFSGWRIA